MMLFKDAKVRWLVLAGVLVILFEILSFAGLKLPSKEAMIVFGTIIIALGYRTLWKGIVALFHLNFSSIHVLMIIALVGAFYLGSYEEAAVVIVLFSLAERLEDVGIAKSRSSLDQLIEEMPRYAQIKGMDEPFNLDRVRLGDIILIKPHHRIPLDGNVVAGSSFVDESAITGESIPVDKQLRDKVYAGTLNLHQTLEVQVTSTAADSTVARIRELTLKALRNKAKTQQFIETFSSYYTPTILVLAFFLIFSSFFSLTISPLEALRQALTLLVIACPCALVISTPIAIFSALSSASRAGVMIKGGKYLERIAQLKVFAFDKTRTLTRGFPIVTDVIPFGKKSREALLSCAAGVEFLSEHPLGKSVVDAAKKEGLSLHHVEKFENVAGKGAKADCLVCDDRHRCIGKLQFILEEHSVPPFVVQEIEALQKKGKTVIVVSTHKEVEGLIAFQDEVRKEAAGVIKILHQKGIHTAMVTGDHIEAAQAVAKVVGITHVFAELLPQEKAKKMEELEASYGPVGMVGDGVNDAPALAAASVGISMTGIGSDAAIESASIVILNEHLKMLPYLMRLGKKTLTLIRFNTLFAIAIKLLFVGLTFVGLSQLGLAIFADVGVTLLVILNSLRLLHFV